MSAKTKPLHRALLGFAALAAAGGAFAFSFILNDSTGLPVKWPAGTVRIRLLLGDTANLEDGSSFNSSARTAATAWNVHMGSVQFSTETGSGSATDGNGVNELAFSNQIFGRDFGDNVLAVTTTRARGNERTEGDILYNTKDHTWNSYRGGRRNSPADIQRVTLHELGHLLGLDHPDEDGQTVPAIMNSRIGDRFELSDDDIAGAQSMYGPRSPLVPENDNFAGAITLALGPGGTVTTKGYNTNATKETGEPSHANDEAEGQEPNPGGRSVWWNWAAPSTASVTIDTVGSYIDTILGVYTGNTVTALTKVASDDDTKLPTATDPRHIQASTVAFNATAGTVYRIAVDGFNNRDNAGADNGGITLNIRFDGATGTAPVITTQPISITRNPGEAAGFSVSASGTGPFTYQWQFNSVDIAGATNNTYSILNVQAGNAGTYRCVVSNASGSTTSNGATLTVNTPPPVTPPSGGGGGGGGGGGAPSLWFLAALAALGAARCLRARG